MKLTVVANYNKSIRCVVFFPPIWTRSKTSERLLSPGVQSALISGPLGPVPSDEGTALRQQGSGWTLHSEQVRDFPDERGSRIRPVNKRLLRDSLSRQ